MIDMMPGAVGEGGQLLPYESYEKAALDWVQSAVQEGEAILKSEPLYDEIEQLIAYMMGEQTDPRRPMAWANTVDNRTKHINLQSVAALTDIHPLFGFKTFNDAFQTQNNVLQKLTQAWWINSFSDLRLADAVKIAQVAGTAYLEVCWDDSMYGGQGDIALVAHDPRDVLPFRPTFNGSVQTWEGAIIRSTKSINELRARYPIEASGIKPDRDGTVLARTWSRAKKIMAALVTPAPLDGISGMTPANVVKRIPTVDVYQVYVKDRSLHTGGSPVVIGDPDTDWSYTVYPLGWLKPDGTRADKKDNRLYPRGRYIICTRSKILYDGPNPYWHGMIPLAKLSLDPWPWSFLGGSLVKDLKPIQDVVNELTNGILDACRKALQPGVIADKRAVPDSQWINLDTRKAGMKAKINAATGQGFKFTDPPVLPSYIFETLKLAIGELDYHADVANLTALTQLQQAPGADSVERLQEALSPVLRLKGRLLEAFLREVGEMVKSNFFQFYNLPRRVSILGETGVDFSEFDFDPGTLVPSLSSTDPGYAAHYDHKVPRAERAQHHAKQFTFTMTPNSLLAISQISRKMMYLQLNRMGLMDRWSLYDVLEIPNGGAPPGGATTITDRLMAEQMLFAPPPVNPAGRKSSGQSPPTMQQKPDQNGIPRQVVSESGSGGG
jgi:hypothetical protein